MDNVDLECRENVKFKPNGNDSGFMTYSNTICFYGILLDNSSYLITQWKKWWKNFLSYGFKNKDVNKVRKISGKDYIITFEEKLVAPILN